MNDYNNNWNNPNQNPNQGTPNNGQSSPNTGNEPWGTMSQSDSAQSSPSSPSSSAPSSSNPSPSMQSPSQPQAQQQPSFSANEPRTPYQVPVRQQSSWQESPYQQQSQQSPPQSAPQFAQPSAQQQTQQTSPFGDAVAGAVDVESKKKPKNRGKKIVIGLSAVAAACLLFAGGAAIGNHFSTPSNDTGSNAESYVGAKQAFGNSDMPTVQISGVPKIDADNYDANEMPGEEIYKKVNPSIVSVISTNLNGSGGTGSGVIMSEDGYIITNNHVVVNESTGAEVDKVTVQLDDGTQLAAAIEGRDAKTDLAVLKVEPNGKLQAAEFGDSDKLQPGEYAYAIGSPGGVELANTITGGRISAINRDITVNDRVMSLIQTDASINPGNSGGALINKYGQVVGITSAKLGISYYEGLGFAIPMNTVKEVVDELIVNGYVAGRPSIGITGWNISEQQANAAHVPQGVYIESIDERATAYNEGLQVKDIITQVNGQDITVMDEINEIKEDLKAGDKLNLRVYRMSTGKFVDVTITLTDEHDLETDTSAQQQQEQESQWGEDGYYRYGEFEDPFSYFFGW